MIKYSLEIEESAAPEELDESFREQELSKEFINVSHAGFKDGKIAFGCSEC